jgi:hypothetical protein
LAIDLPRFNAAIKIVIASLDHRDLTTICQLACKYYDTEPHTIFVESLINLIDAQPHWQTELLLAVLHVNHLSAFALFHKLWQRPSTQPQTIHTARYISRACTGESDILIGFDLAREHLASLRCNPSNNESEIIYFAELTSSMPSVRTEQTDQRTLVAE